MADQSRAGIILAGGKSTRFGSDKASALLAGRPMLTWVAGALAEICTELVIVRARGQALPPLDLPVPVRVVEDRWEGKGPLAGLATAFAATSASLCFATSCDVPLVRPALVSRVFELAHGYDVVCPRVDGYLQPLAAVYRPAACLPVFEDFVERDMLKITAAFGPLRTLVVAEDDLRGADPSFDTFVNANTPARLAELEERLALRAAGDNPW